MTILQTCCVDASLVGRIITGSFSVEIETLVKSWRVGPVMLVAPSLIGYEIANTMHRKRSEGMSQEQVNHALQNLGRMDIELVYDEELHKESTTIARALNHSAAYDAHYLAVSIRRGTRFITCDRRLSNSAAVIYNWVDFINPV